MKLVDYSDSDSETSPSDEEPSSPPPAPKPQHATLPPKKPKKQIIVDLPKPSKDDDDGPARKRPRTEGGKGGLFATLPPPKRSKPVVNQALKEAEVKHGVTGGENVIPASVETIPQAPPTTFAPRSAQAKKSKTIPAKQTPPKPSVSLFPLGPDLLSKPTPKPSYPSTYEPLITQPIIPSPEPVEDTFIPDTTTPPPTHISTADLDQFAAHILEGRHRKHRMVEIMDYNAGDVYAQNVADKASGILQDQVQPVRAIGSGRHQLTQLLNNVQQQKDSLEEQFAEGRRVKKESGAKYGW
jgi:hypothetical protein